MSAMLELSLALGCNYSLVRFFFPTILIFIYFVSIFVYSLNKVFGTYLLRERPRRPACPDIAWAGLYLEWICSNRIHFST